MKEKVLDNGKDMIKEEFPPMTREQMDAFIKERNLTESQKKKLLKLNGYE